MCDMETIISLAKRRGFIFPGSEIYGGLAGTWDYGPLGTFLKENIKREWFRAMVSGSENIFPLDSAILMNKKVFEASGHIEHFSDPMADCKKCKKRFRADDLIQHPVLEKKTPGANLCSECGGELTEARPFQMMFKTHAGAVESEENITYLRPETAQGIFVNFKNIIDSFHPKLPFGVAQIGKAFRNEITPRNFLFRSREFEQMELEYFVRPDDASSQYDFWKNERMNWFLNLGINKENIRFRDYEKDELAHYSAATTDIEYRFGLSGPPAGGGFSELEGIANRTDFDLKTHSKNSGVDLKLDDVIPYVIEPSLGLDRAFLAFLMDAYSEEKDRTILKLHPKLAPVKVAVFPLLANKENLVEKAREIYKNLKPHFTINWDDRGNIGKRYYAQDEIGTPWCVTIDFQTLEDGTVTVRDRDSGKQERISAEGLEKYFEDKLA
jgi:glycyl-tRNA synthetase